MPDQPLERFLCQSCDSISIPSPVVINRGNISSKLMLIGEAPGRTEEKEGLPFVGRSGKLLNKILQSTGFDCEQDVYITNLLKSRPPANRPPTQREIAMHLPWLYQQINQIDPLIIVLMGSSSLRAILGSNSKITKLRGTWQNWKGFFLMPIFHPSYLLRNPSRDIGKPFDLTLIDLLEVRKKLLELESFPKS